MKKILLILPLLVTLTACQISNTKTNNSAERPVEGVTIVHNATIYTVDENTPETNAFAYQNGKILALNDAKTLLARYPNAHKLDLAGATVVPGFIDAHGHLLGLGESLGNADLMGSTSKQDIIRRLQQHAVNLPEGQWLLGRGWDQNDWSVKELPNAADLDAAFPNRPVWLERVDGHASWANTLAMQFASQDLNGNWQPDGGEIVRVDGQATGVFVDNAVSIIQSKLPATSDTQLRSALERAMNKTASVGLTGMHDAGTSLKTWKLLQQLNNENKLGVRVYAMANGANDMLNYLCDNGTAIDSNAMLTARAIKLYSDGALGSRGAALLADYSDAPGNVGLLIESEASLKTHAKRAVGCGLQVNIHAIGDRGNRVTLNVLEAASSQDNPGRHRVEHSQVIEAGDFKRFKDLKLIASVQPTHATSDMYWAEDRVGSERVKGAYAWQNFVALGVPLALGSDFPVEQPDPLHGFHSAIARQDAKNWPENGWYPQQTLTRLQALHGFTQGAAYAAFQENQVGSLSAGKYADFVVLSKDIMRVPSEEIRDTKILATYLNGEPIFSASN